MTVQVDKFDGKKNFIGGFRNKRNGLAYHNAFTQTDQDVTYHPDKRTKEIQTYQYNTKSTTMMREFGTQMEKPGLYIDKRNDKIIYSKPAYTSDMWEEDRAKMALYIQCRIRGWFSKRLANKLRQL